MGQCKCGKDMFLYRQQEERRIFFCIHCGLVVSINPYQDKVEITKNKHIMVIHNDKEEKIDDLTKNIRRK